MKWLKRIALAVAVLLLALGAFGFWLLESESGARFALERVKSALADKLSYAQAHGALASPLELTDVHYRDPQAGLDVRIKRVKVEYSLSGLLHKTLRVSALDADGIALALTSVPPPAVQAPPPKLETLLTPPLAIRVEQAHIGTVAVTQDGAPLFACDSLDTALDWTASALEVSRFALRTPDGTLDLNARVDSYKDLRGKGHAAFDWRAGTQRATGSADFGSDGRNASAHVSVSQPTAATLDASVEPGADALPWSLKATMPRFDPRKLVPDASLAALALNLDGSGDRTHGRVSGAVDLDAHRVLLQPLEFSLAPDKTLTLEGLTLRSPEAAGTLQAKGTIALGADPVAAQLALDWDGVEIPADLAGQALATHGHLAASGSAQAYKASGEFTLGPKGKPADFSLALQGTPQMVELQRLALKQPAGGLDAHGTLALKPTPGWDLDIAAHRFDPGAFAAEWPGAIDAALHTRGRQEKTGPAGTLTLTQFGGTLRKRPVSGSADLKFAAPAQVDGTLNLKSGNSTVSLRGRGGDSTDVTLDLALASLGDWLPDAAGALKGSAGVRGTWPKLDAKAKFDANTLVYAGVHIDAATIALDVHDVSAPDGTLVIGGKHLAAAGYTFDTFAIDAHGNQAAHRVALNLQGPQLGLEIALDGALKQNPAPAQWNARIGTFALTPKGAAPWALTHPANLRVAGADVSLDEFCLAAQNASVCASATQAAGATKANFAIKHLPLTLIASLASPDAPLKLDGEIDGSGELTRGADGALAGHAEIGSAAGAVAYPDSATQPLLAYTGFHAQATLGTTQSALDVRAQFSDGGNLTGHVALGASGANGMPLSGTVDANLTNLGFVDLLTSQTSGTKGKLVAKILLSGSTGAPGVAGNVSLAGFATEVPSAGLKLHDGNVTLQSGDGRSFAVTGSIGSSDGKLSLGGNVGTAPDAPFALTLNGENWLAADIPGAQVRISPDLKITREAGTYVVNGSVGIPKADIDVSKLQASNPSAARSPDVVVSDAERQKDASSAPVRADITVKLGAGEKLAMDLRQGQEVHLVGFGLNGYLSGQLAVQDTPGRATTGRGQIVVDGTYKAYGQDLKIEQGRLLFAGTPIDNPGLDLRATRSGFADPDVTVGLQVRGTAQVPVLTVFSEPAMEQSDALSYLVAGKPMSQLKSGEGDAVGSAARALGTAGGDLLAKSIGTRMGLDDVGVADSSAVGGAALTVGKYLSPRLYLSYGVGLFTPGEVVTLRYRLTRLFNVEIQNGTLSSRAGINYKVEK